MYEQHFGFSELPFCLTPDTQFYHASRWHREARTVLEICINQGEGFVKITGEVGTGKTMLCRCLLNSLSAEYIPVYIPNPYLRPEGLFCAIAHELGIKTDTSNSHVVLKAIEEELVQLTILGHKVILVVDEAQSMPAETLEALRLVTNLETEKFKLLQVVLFGQPELDIILQQPALRQLLQRVSFSYSLQSLDFNETQAYLTHRLQCASYEGALLFEPGAAKYLYRASMGIPRLINILAHKSLMCAFGKQRQTVSKAFVKAAVNDTEGVSRPKVLSFMSMRYAAALALFVVPAIASSLVVGSFL
jgi:MSHA biogenesis protein MshM